MQCMHQMHPSLDPADPADQHMPEANVTIWAYFLQQSQQLKITLGICIRFYGIFIN